MTGGVTVASARPPSTMTPPRSKRPTPMPERWLRCSASASPGTSGARPSRWRKALERASASWVPGAKADVIGDRLVNRDAIGRDEAKAARQQIEIRRRAQGVGALDEGRRGGRDGEAGHRMVDREPDAAETPAEPAIEVEKPKVKPGGGDRGDAFKHEVSFAGFSGDLRQGLRAFTTGGSGGALSRRAP